MMATRKAASADQLADQLANLAPRHEAPAAPMPAEQARPERWPARISMTASQEMKRDLEVARLDDGIEVTARLRAMIALWQEDPKLRGKVARLARDLR
jgi:glucose/arabinose dehydrogenase